MYEDILAAAIVQKALNGDAGAHTLLGQALDQHGQYQDAVKWLRSAADQGYDAAQLCLGNEYFWGRGVAQDYTLAQYWWRKAAEQGLAEGQALLGAAYYKGYGVAKNQQEAVSWLEKAAAQGNDRAISLLATIKSGTAGPQSAGGAAGQNQTMFCGRCGAQIPADSEFCPHCGSSVRGGSGGAGAGGGQNSKRSGCSAFVVAALVMLGVLGILAAIALPAYSKYTARAKFTEVTTAAGAVKQQVELCYFDLGTLDGCSDDRSGNGWNLERAVQETQSRYVDSVVVKDGVIGMISRNIKLGGQNGFTEIFVPRSCSTGSSGDSALCWSIAPDSTCKQKDLC